MGAYVDEEICVENDEVIKDQVLTHSKGCIENCDKVSEKSSDGVVHVVIHAVVKPNEVVKRLRGAKVEAKEMSGEDFWAWVTSRRQQEKDAAALLRKTFDGFPKNCLKADTIGKPGKVPMGGERSPRSSSTGVQGCLDFAGVLQHLAAYRTVARASAQLYFRVEQRGAPVGQGRPLRAQQRNEGEGRSSAAQPDRPVSPSQEPASKNPAMTDEERTKSRKDGQQ